MAGMYLDTDCVLALIKQNDWLKEDVEKRIKDHYSLYTSILTVIECKLVISREMKRDEMYDLDSLIQVRNIRFLPLDTEVERISNHLLKKYDFLGIFDSIHAATSIVHSFPILSTDHIFPLMEELTVEDPRGFEKV